MVRPAAPGNETDHRNAAALVQLDRLGPALQRHDRASIVDCVRRIVDLSPVMGEQWQALAQVAASNGELGLCRMAMDALIAETGNSPGARYAKSGVLAEAGLWREALEILESLGPDQPDPAAHAYSHGTAALYAGRLDAAREQLERALVLRPHSGTAWQAMAMLVDFAQEPDLAERIVSLEPDIDRGPVQDRAEYHYALGKAYADIGDHARAFAAFSQGARLVKSVMHYDCERDRLIGEDAVEGYEAGRIAQIAGGQSEATGRAMFVTGLPRSGTTLVEQILTSHSAVDDGAETNLLSFFVREIGGLAYPALAQRVEEVGAPFFAQLWSHWLEQRFPRPGHVVDKTANNTRLLGLAAALLPEAPLIWVTRDRLDCAWSCFRTSFVDAMPWSYDLADIAHHFRIEDQLLERWRQVLGDRLLVVPYESLVTEPQSWIARILAHCGLAQEPGPFSPHLNSRTVTTASVMQVRRPINRRGIGVAEPYREYLAPFIDG